MAARRKFQHGSQMRRIVPSPFLAVAVGLIAGVVDGDSDVLLVNRQYLCGYCYVGEGLQRSL